jgi:hypothetical protein
MISSVFVSGLRARGAFIIRSSSDTSEAARNISFRLIFPAETGIALSIDVEGYRAAPASFSECNSHD